MNKPMPKIVQTPRWILAECFVPDDVDQTIQRASEKTDRCSLCLAGEHCHGNSNNAECQCPICVASE